MNNSIICNWCKCIILFLVFSDVTCEVISEEVTTKLQEAYCDVSCMNEVNCECSPSETELQFQNHTIQIQIEWLCRDDTIISFQLSSNETLTYVFEYGPNGNWTFCETANDTFAILEDLEIDEEYQIKVWGVSADSIVYGPFFSEPVKTIEENYLPLQVRKFELVAWELGNGKSFDAVLEWTPAEDRLCFYEIMVHTRTHYEGSPIRTKDMKSLFRTKISGFHSGENYSVSISPKPSDSFSISGVSRSLSVSPPNCLDLYKSVDVCVPDPPKNVSVTEEISIFFKHEFLNVTFDIYVTWSPPQYIPDNHTLEIIVFENGQPRIVQSVKGEATSVVFYNVTVTPHYNLVITSRSKAGSGKSLHIDRMINIRPNMIAVRHVNPEKNNCIFIILIVICVMSVSIMLGICLMKLVKTKFKNNKKEILPQDNIEGGTFKKLDIINHPICR